MTDYLAYTFLFYLVQRCYQTDDNRTCVNADRYCSQNIDAIFDKSGRNFYDVRVSSSIETPPEDYVNLLNLPDFQKAIGVDRIHFESCADDPVISFIFSLSLMTHSVDIYIV